MQNLAGVDLNLLVAFDALLVERNVTRAGRRIGLSQPALSKALQRLRYLFDDRLFERRHGVMIPTARALELGKFVRRAFSEIEAALAPRDFDPGLASGSVTIGSIDFYDLVLLPPLVQRLRREAPGVDILVRRTDRLRAPSQLAAGDIDFAIVPVSEGTTDLVAEPLFQERALTIMAKENPLTGGMTPESFAAAGHVTVAVEGQGVNWIDARLSAMGLRRRIVISVPSFLIAPIVAASTDLISTLPARLVDRLRPLADLVAAPPPIPAPQMTIHLAWHSHNPLSPVQLWLRQRLREVASAI